MNAEGRIQQINTTHIFPVSKVIANKNKWDWNTNPHAKKSKHGGKGNLNQIKDKQFMNL